MTATFNPDWCVVMDDDARPAPDCIARFRAELSSHTAVSYTHLDVYKRQVIPCVHEKTAGEAHRSPPPLPPLPGWITAASDETLESAAFRSGAALAYLSLATATGDVPTALWRDRLAVLAAEVCVGFAGRRERVGTCLLYTSRCV